MYLEKQPPLMNFTDWLHTGEDPHPSIWLDILGSSESLWGVAWRLWTCAQIEGLSGSLCRSSQSHVPVGLCAAASLPALSCSEPQASRECRLPVMAQETDRSLLANSPKSWKSGCTLHSSSSLLGEPSVMYLLQIIWLRTTPTHPLSHRSQFSVTLTHSHHASFVRTSELRVRRSGNQLLQQLSQTWVFGHMFHSSLCPRGEATS